MTCELKQVTVKLKYQMSLKKGLVLDSACVVAACVGCLVGVIVELCARCEIPV